MYGNTSVASTSPAQVLQIPVSPTSCRVPAGKLQSKGKKKFHLAGEQLNTPLVTSAETCCKDFTISVALTLIVSLCLMWEDKMRKRRTTHELFVVGFLMLPRTLPRGLQHLINLLQEQRNQY